MPSQGPQAQWLCQPVASLGRPERDRRIQMIRCPECEAEIESDSLDEFDVDIGDRLVCTICEASLEVTKVSPVELALESESDLTDIDNNGAAGPSSEIWDEDDEWES